MQPEQVETYELGLEQMIAKYWRFTATGYYMHLDKLISSTRIITDKNFFQQVNTNSQNGYGGIFELRRQWENGVLLRSSYSIQYAESENDGSIQYAINKSKYGSSIPDIPHHLYQLNLMAPLFTPELRGGLDMQTLSSRQSFSGKVPGYTRLNLSLLYQPIKYVDLSASIYDLLNSNRIEASPEPLPLMPQEGRTFRLKMEFRF